jgi:hypothetical protein
MKKTKEQHIANRQVFMTNDDITRIDDYITDLLNNKGDMNALYSEWADIEDFYENEQEEVSGMPNSKINIINSNIEGQTAMIIDQDIAIMTKGESAGDDDFADDARIGLEWTFRKNYIKKVMKSFIRRYMKFGAGCFSVHFDPTALNDFGLVKIHAMPLTNIFIDGKVKDPLRYQEADWIAEAQRVSKTQLKEWYGEEKAEAVIYGNEVIVDQSVFNIDDSFDDYNGATLIKYWSRCEGKLRLQEFTGDGLLMYDSHKKGNRKDNQIDMDENIVSYYKHVMNKYPYFMAFLYEREGNLWSFGDGKLLLPLQKLINKLYDNIIISSRPKRHLIDIRSDIDVDDLNENSAGEIPFDGTETNNAPPLYTVDWGTTNNNWWELINALHNEAQRITRFSDIMTGQNSKGTDTATEAAIQQQQGSRSTDDKKSDVQTTMQEMCSYILGIMIEKYQRGKSFKVSDKDSSYKWIDFREMSSIPVKVPATKKFRDKYMEKNGGKIPQWELLTSGDGNPMTKNLELDIQVDLGAGLPKNKAFITKFLQDMAGLIMVAKDGTQKPAIYQDEFRSFLQKYVGLPLKDDQSPVNVQQPIKSSNTPIQPNQNPNQPLGENGGVLRGPANQARAI